jgi:hypothetical protein
MRQSNRAKLRLQLAWLEISQHFWGDEETTSRMDESNCGSSVTMFVKFNAEIDFFLELGKRGTFFRWWFPKIGTPAAAQRFPSRALQTLRQTSYSGNYPSFRWGARNSILVTVYRKLLVSPLNILVVVGDSRPSPINSCCGGPRYPRNLLTSQPPLMHPRKHNREAFRVPMKSTKQRLPIACYCGLVDG